MYLQIEEVDILLIPSYLGQTGGSWDWCLPGSFLSTSYILSSSSSSFLSGAFLMGFEILVVYSVGLGLGFFVFYSLEIRRVVVETMEGSQQNIQNSPKFAEVDEFQPEMVFGRRNLYRKCCLSSAWLLRRLANVFLCRIFSPTPVSQATAGIVLILLN